MSVQVQHRRDTNTNLEANTPAAGELWWDITKNELSMGNGALAGGVRMAKKNIREILAPAQIAANTNDYNPTGLKHAAVLRLTTDASRNLTGLAPTTVNDTVDGRTITLYNAGSFNLVVQDQNVASAATNRFDLGGSDITISQKQSITLRYSLTLLRWEISEGNFGGAISDGAVSARKLATSAFGANAGMINGTIVESHTGNAATFAIKTLAGNDPSLTDPVYFVFRDVTPGLGDFVVRTVTAALNFTLSAGSAIGFSSGVPGKFWLAAVDNAGTVLLGAINCLSGQSIFPLAGFGIITTVAEGGAGAADNAQVMYAASAVASKSYLALGYAAYEAGVVTTGNWASSPTRLQLFGPGVALPGMEIQQPGNTASAVAVGTTTVPYDDTIPQNTEGDQYLSQAITPNSACHLLEVSSQLQLSPSAANNIMVSLYQDATANALATVAMTIGASSQGIISLSHRLLAALTTATTFKIRAGGNGAGTNTLNGGTSARLFGGSSSSFIRVREFAT